MVVNNVEKRCKASHSEFQEIWPGLKRCMVCGFALATVDSEERSDEPGKENRPKYPKEDTLHSTYHGKFYKAKAQYGYSNVLDYKVLKSKEETLIENLKHIKDNDVSQEYPMFHSLFEKIQLMLKEVRKWTDTYKDDKSSTIQSLYTGLRSNINDIRALCRQGVKTTDVSELVVITQDILPIYRSLFDTVKCVKDMQNSNVTKDYNGIPVPDFTFDIETESNYFETFMQIIPTKQNKVEGILNDLYTVEYTRSLRLWDMCKPHPRFEHYVTILWNTPKFLDFIRSFMTDAQFNFYVNKYKANRQLTDYNFKEAPFYFGRVILSPCCEKAQKEAKALKKVEGAVFCNKKCANCPLGYVDISYMDKLAEASDEEDDDTDGYENTADYKESTQALTALGQLMNRK